VRKLIVVTAAVLAAVVFFLFGSLPPRPVRLPLDSVAAEIQRRTVSGAYHIHTTRSDGADARPAIAAAAARAGLRFAIFTDHGDATRPPEPPAYIDGVLCIDAVEISTNGGHYVALGLAAAPYPLAGEASAVVEDVARLGGFGFAAHPDHPTTELAWTDWIAPVDGLEWLNADSEWRTESRLALARTVLSYLLRPAPAIASVLDRPNRTLERWDELSGARRVVALAAVDAHGAGRAALSEDAEPRVVVGPSYEASFRTLSNRVVLERPFTGDASSDARELLDALKRGSVYSVVDAISPDVIVDLDPERLQILSPLPPGADVQTIAHDGARRLEIVTPQSPGEPPVPWVLTNWIYAGGVPPYRPDPPTETAPSASPIGVGEWRIEKDASSNGEVTQSPGAITLRYALGSGARGNQFAAAAADLQEGGAFDTLVFRARASKPMRVSVQLRFPPDDQRWVKSIYLDADERELVVPVRNMVPAEPSSGGMSSARTARSLLFVVDLVNAAPGAAGEFTFSDVRVARP
jgi:hypothetical protein